MARNQRKSSRNQVANDRQVATLIVNNHRFSVRVIDESAGGFAIVSPFRLPIVENQNAELISSWVHSVVRLAHIEQYPDGQLIGVTRVRNVTAEPVSDSEAGSYFGQLQRAGVIYSRAAAGGAIGLVAASLLILFMATEMVAWERRDSSTSDSKTSRLANSTARTTSTGLDCDIQASPIAKTQRTSQEPTSIKRANDKGVAKAAVQRQARHAASFVSTSPQLADLLSNPQVIQQLHLTAGQQQQIDALRELTAHRSFGTTDYAAQAILEVLSKSQQQQLSQLRSVQ